MTNVPADDDPMAGWSIEPPVDFEIGSTYIVRANHEVGFWADFLIEITGYDPVGDDYRFKLLTMLDGTPEILEAFLE